MELKITIKNIKGSGDPGNTYDLNIEKNKAYRSNCVVFCMYNASIGQIAW